VDAAGPLLFIAHPGVSRDEIIRSIVRRWPDAVACDPVVASGWDRRGRLELALIQRGVEPLRVWVAAQRCVRPPRSRRIAAMAPMPVLFSR
jgi:hypothetical protein